MDDRTEKEKVEEAFRVLGELPPRAEPPLPLDPPAADPEVWIAYCEWKAQQLNRLFLEHGATPHQAGHIAAATVADGLRKAHAPACAVHGAQDPLSKERSVWRVN